MKDLSAAFLLLVAFAPQSTYANPILNNNAIGHKNNISLSTGPPSTPRESTGLTSTPRESTRPPPKLWDPSGIDFPNPWTNYQACNRPAASLVCDPDRVLTEQEADNLDNLIRDSRRKARCACTRCSGDTGRFFTAVAVARQLATTNPSSDVTRDWATGVRLNWGKSLHCNSDLNVIGLVIKGPQVAGATSPGGRRLLPNLCVRDIIEYSSKYFRDRKWYEGLKNMLEYFSNALSGGCCGRKGGLCLGQIIGIVIGVIAGVATIVSIVVLIVGFCQNWDCVMQTCLGICIGAILGCIQGCINAIIASLIASVCEACGCDDCVCEPCDCIPDLDDDGYRADDGGGGAAGGF